MSVEEELGARFEAHRGQLGAVAFRMLGSRDEAEDAVQEAWLRLRRAGGDGIDNLGGWLTTVVARVCLDALRSRKARREDALDAHGLEPAIDDADAMHPEREAMLADSVGAALLVVLERLAPAERVAFVLHDIFDVPFDTIGRIVERTPEATRQLASRARKRVSGADASPGARFLRQRDVVDAFRAASRGGDFGALLALLDPEAVMRADAVAVEMGAPAEVRGADAVAQFIFGRARGARRALLDGAATWVWAPGGRVRVAFRFTIANDKVSAIELIGNRDAIAQLDLVLLNDEAGN